MQAAQGAWRAPWRLRARTMHCTPNRASAWRG
jgi:hypothetical protein